MSRLSGRPVRISQLDGGGLVIEMLEPAGMVFDLLPLSQTTFLLEGAEQKVVLKLDPEDPARDKLVLEGAPT